MSGLADAPLYLDCRQPPHLDSRRSAITATVAREGLDLVAVDPPSQVIAHHAQHSPESQLHEVLRRLKHLAMQLRIHIITTAELERPPRPSGRYSDPGEHPPQVSDLKNPNAVMETADIVVLLHRPDTEERYYPRAGQADLFVVKNRYGILRKVTIAHQLHYARFATMTSTPPAPAM